MRIYKDPKKITVLLIALLALASAVFLLYRGLVPAEEPLAAVISVDGKQVAALLLKEESTRGETSLLERFGVDMVIEHQGERIRVKSSDCPDKICVNAGWLSKDMDIAVCLPNKTAVTVMPASQAGEAAFISK